VKRKMVEVRRKEEEFRQREIDLQDREEELARREELQKKEKEVFEHESLEEMKRQQELAQVHAAEPGRPDVWAPASQALDTLTVERSTRYNFPQGPGKLQVEFFM
jgi:hypothetical protein